MSNGGPQPPATRLAAVAAVLLFLAAPAIAQDAPPASAGDGAWGLPSIVHVPVLHGGGSRLTIAGTAGYGFTEEQADEGGAHHRAAGSLAAGLVATSWLSASLRVDGRYDAHPDDALGADHGWMGVPRLALRAGVPPSGPVAFGAELAVALPGRDPPSLVLEAARVDARLLASLATTDLVVAAYAGYRIDGSGAAIEQPDRLRPGDRVALGFSDSNALLLGLGASYRTGAIDLLGELTWDLLVGDDAPPAGESPMHVAAGARYRASDTLSLELIADAVVTGRAAQGPGIPLAPIDPRFAISLGLRYAIPLGPRPVDAEIAAPDEVDEIDDDAEDTATDVTPAGRTIAGRVLGPDGSAAAGANVQLAIDGAEPRTTRTDEGGNYRFEEVPDGPARLIVEADGFDRFERVIAAGETEPETVQLVRAVARGDLRGLVRSFDGDPLAATVRVDTANVEVAAGADGRFTIPLEVGSHRVTIVAPGFREQTRSVTIRENGVTILNVELYRGR